MARTLCNFLAPSNSSSLLLSHSRGVGALRHHVMSKRPRGRTPRRKEPTSLAATAPIDPFEGPALLPEVPPLSFDGNGAAVLWFRNDLRLRDNQALDLANSAQLMMPVYVFDERQYSYDHPSPYGFQRTGPFRAHFIRSSVDDLRDSLITLGNDMLVRVGRPDEVLCEAVGRLLDAGCAPVRVVAQKEVTRDEVAVEREVERALADLATKRDIDDIEVVYVWGSTMHHYEDLPFNPCGKALPDQFTKFLKWIESNEGPEVRHEYEVPEKLTPYPFGLMMKSTIPSLGDDLGVEGAHIGEPNDWPFPDHRAVMGFEGGPNAADQRVNDYIWEGEALPVYKSTRNSSGTIDYSSKLSPYLALGCLSPRSLYWQAKEYEMKHATPEDTYHFIYELLWRDYYKWCSCAVGSRLFAHNGFSGWWRDEPVVWKAPEVSDLHRERLQRWIEGNTGAPFVDASMRELAHTGFMSDRGRQNAASFLINDLQFPDWRAGAEYFESMLIDHDVASNWGNWATMANVGSRRRPYRMNVIKQSAEYDSDGWFIQGWCPELALVPKPYVHAPHTMDEATWKEYRLERDDVGEYPKPIVELPEAPADVKPKVQTPFPPIPDFSDLFDENLESEITTTTD